MEGAICLLEESLQIQNRSLHFGANLQEAEIQEGSKCSCGDGNPFQGVIDLELEIWSIFQISPKASKLSPYREEKQIEPYGHTQVGLVGKWN